MSLYTKDGVPLTVSTDVVFGPNGKEVGRISGSKVFGSGGRYVGTIVGDRLVYRSTDSAGVESASVPFVSRPASAQADQAGSALWGDEPQLD